MKKSSIIISTIFVSIVLIGAIYFFNLKQKQSNINLINTGTDQVIDNTLDDNNMITGNNCEKLEHDINNLIEQVKDCKVDSDCFIDDSIILGCPFDCFFIRSHFSDDGEYLSLIETKIKNYKNDCPICKHKCPIAPEYNDIKCVANKCMDTRFAD